VNAALEQLALRVKQASGIEADGSRLAALGAAVTRLGAGSPGEVLRRLDEPVGGPELLLRLVDEVAVKETFFLRNADELVRLDWRSLHADARVRGADRVRVWCTACASGDEAYSLAILALEAFWPLPPPVEILATDIAPSALARARAGRYRDRAVAHVPTELRDRWLERVGATMQVREAVRALVRFERHNLVRDPMPPLGEAPFDVITCRNVLIYFAADQVAGTVRGLRSALVPDGRLVLGAADRLSGSRVLGREDPTRRGAPSRTLHPVAERAVRQGPRETRPGRAAHMAAARGDAGSGTVSAARQRRATSGPDAPEVNPELDADVALLLGRAARARGDHGDAVRWLRRTLYLDPDRAVAALELSLAHAARGETGAQRRALWTALRTAEAAGGSDNEELAAECRSRLAALDEPRDGVAS
jgi:chemotaxis protein methyltransferase CheR